MKNVTHFMRQCAKLKKKKPQWLEQIKTTGWFYQAKNKQMLLDHGQSKENKGVTRGQGFSSW